MSPLHGTPLHIACKMGNIKIVQQLLINGADISVKSPKNGKLPKDISDNARIAFLIEKYEQMKALEADDSSRSSGDEEEAPQTTSKLNSLFSSIKQGVIKSARKESQQNLLVQSKFSFVGEEQPNFHDETYLDHLDEHAGSALDKAQQFLDDFKKGRIEIQPIVVGSLLA